MPRWEMCRIEREIREVGTFRKKRLFSLVAIIDTLNGPKIIDKSAEYEEVNIYDDRAMKKFNETNQREYSGLVSRLLADDWEPLSTKEYGWVMSFRRQVP